MAPPKKKICLSQHEGPDVESSPVHVLAGPPSHRKKFWIQPSLLTIDSHFFASALDGNPREQPILLPEVDAAIFEIWVKYLYSGHMYLKQPGDTHEALWRRWSLCYALGAYLLSPGFADACIDACAEILCDADGIPKDLPGWIYRHSERDSAHREFVVKAFVNCQPRHTWEDYASAEKVFLADVVGEVGEKLTYGLKWSSFKVYLKDMEQDMGVCAWHDHGVVLRCYRKGE